MNIGALGQPICLCPSAPALERSRRFSVALSFQSHHRSFVSEVAAELSQLIGRDRVFYDKYFEGELSRPDLDVYLQNIYSEMSNLLAIFLSEQYKNSEWCGVEWRVIRDLIKCGQGPRLMLLRFDEVEIPGLLSVDGFVHISDRPASEVAKLINRRLGLLEAS